MKYSVAEPLVDPYEAVEIFLRDLGSLEIGCEEVPIEDSLGRVACSDIALPIPLPPFPRSLVDGYAVLYSDVNNASRDKPARLRLAGRIDVGASADHIKIQHGACYEVATGSHVPVNADLVIPFEHAEERGEEVLIYRSFGVGAFIAYPGSDMPSGSLIVRRGWVIDEKILAALASAGIKRISVRRKPRVCIVATGKELLEPGEPLRPGMVYESNLRTLAALLSSEGFSIVSMGVVSDDRDYVRRSMLDGVEKCDLVITTGGTSAGVEDHVYRVINEMGRIVVRGIKYKPGKPLTLGIVRGRAIIGLPGNPVSVVMLSKTVLKKLFERIRGVEEAPTASPQGRARILRRISASEGRTTHMPSILIRGSGGLYILPWVVESYMISRLSLADVYIEIHHARGKPLEVGEEVEYRALRRDPRTWLLEAGEIAGKTGVVGDRLRILTSRDEAERWLDMGAASLVHVCDEYSLEGDRAMLWITILPKGERYHKELKILSRDKVEKIPSYASGTCFSDIIKEILSKRGEKERGVVRVESLEQALDMFMQGLVDIALEPLDSL